MGVPSWIDGLSEEDHAFIRRFVLASGSLKEMAEIYGISYPTVRLRLDRLIEKVKLLTSDAVESEFEYTQGKLDLGTMKRLLNAHKEDT